MTKDSRTPPTPDYPDEVSPRQLDAIRRLVDSRRPKDFALTPIHPPAW